MHPVCKHGRFVLRLRPSSGYVSQFGQDAFLEQRIFCGAENLLFVEIGSADPVEINNTCFLEQRRGWPGLLIEARPSAFVALCEERHSEVVNACLSDQVGRSTFLDYGYLAGLCKFMSPREHACVEQHISGHQQVQAYWVDTLPLDVESAELAILSTIDFEACRVEVILVKGNTSQTAEKVRSFLSARHFLFAEQFGVGFLFIHSQSPWLPAEVCAAQLICPDALPSPR